MFPNFFQTFGFNQNNIHQNQNQPKAQWFAQLTAIPSFNVGREDLENGNKILLPSSVLDIYQRYTVPQPLIFCVQNTFLNKQSFVGVLEFIASEGTCVLPFWLFTELGLEINQKVNVCLNNEIPKGNFVKIQPHETQFINLPNPRAIMEVQFRNYTCITEGETIQIMFNNKQYLIDIIEVRPKNLYQAVSLVDTDIEVDFAPPKDYQELPKTSLMKQTSSVRMEEEERQKEIQQKNPFKGEGYRVDGKAIKQTQSQQQQQQYLQNQLEEYDPRKHRLTNGLRRNIIDSHYLGQGLKLGETKKKNFK